MTRNAFNAEGIVVSGPYSNGVDTGGLVFFSGQTAMNTNTNPATDDIGEQTKLAFQNLSKLLEAAELTPDDVVKVNVYLTDMNDFSAMNEVYKDYFSEPYPARTCIAVLALPLGAKVEIEMIAKRS